jgi:response regulator RpfG family c-di-GMP phosphodiesterase
MAILDWLMPGVEGTGICRAMRARPSSAPLYIVLLTAHGRKEYLIAGLEAGADDFLAKPFNPGELKARIQVGIRIVGLQNALSGRLRELEAASGRIRTLQGLLPLCSYCKRIRDDRDYWHQVDQYIITHTDAQVSHGICPECYQREIEPELKALRDQGDAPMLATTPGGMPEDLILEVPRAAAGR